MSPWFRFLVPNSMTFCVDTVDVPTRAALSRLREMFACVLDAVLGLGRSGDPIGPVEPRRAERCVPRPPRVSLTVVSHRRWRPPSSHICWTAPSESPRIAVAPRPRLPRPGSLPSPSERSQNVWALTAQPSGVTCGSRVGSEALPLRQVSDRLQRKDSRQAGSGIHCVCVWREQLRAWVSGATWAEGLAIKKLWKYSLCLFNEAI